MPEKPDSRVLVSNARRVQVARAYVENLERRSEEFDALQAEHMELTWEAINLAKHCLTLQRALSYVTNEGGPADEREEAILHEVLDNANSLLKEVWECPCGHSKWDHDEHGCAYLGCKPICGQRSAF